MDIIPFITDRELYRHLLFVDSGLVENPMVNNLFIGNEEIIIFPSCYKKNVFDKFLRKLVEKYTSADYIHFYRHFLKSNYCKC